jgi:hypothetical protein
MKRQLIALMILGIMAVLGACQGGQPTIMTTQSAESITFARQLGINYKELKNDQTILATVDKIGITRLEVEQGKIREQFTMEMAKTGFDTEYENPMLTDEAVLQHLIENYVLFLEAKKKDLVISDREVQAYIDTEKAGMKDLNSKDIQVMRDYACGRGMTMDQFLDSFFADYREQFSIGYLRESILRGITDAEARTSAWDQYKADLIQQYQPVIVTYK